MRATVEETRTFRARYFLIGGNAVLTAVGLSTDVRNRTLVLSVARHGLIGWHFFGRQGEVLKPDGGPVVHETHRWRERDSNRRSLGDG